MTFGKAARARSRRLLAQVPTSSPMQLSLDMLRKYGYFAEIVEQSMIQLPGVSHPIKRDLLGFADIIALKDHVLLVQTTSATNVMARVKKIQCCESFEAVKRAGVLVQVHGWGVGGVRVIDMTARDADGSFTYITLFDDIVRAGARSKNRPRVQRNLDL